MDGNPQQHAGLPVVSYSSRSIVESSRDVVGQFCLMRLTFWTSNVDKVSNFLFAEKT
jgi:hypothetical protein